MIVVPFLFVVAKTGFHFYAAEHRYIIEEGFFAFLLLVIVNNMLLEIATAALIGTPIIIALNKVMTQNPAQA
jgi:Na+/H+ antiporter NhaD/arsenite permease-like protein